MPSSDQTIACILAAGEGRRLGGTCKARIEVQGLPLVIQQLNVMQQAGIGHCCVMVGAQSDLVQKIVDRYRPATQGYIASMTVECVDVFDVRPQHLPGYDIQESVRAALRHVRQRFERNAHINGVMVSLVDLPLLAPRNVIDVLERANQSGYTTAVIPVSATGQTGHPLWLSRAFVAQLDLESPGFSLRDMLRYREAHDPSAIGRVLIDHPGPFEDVDTLEDIARVQREHGLTVRLP